MFKKYNSIENSYREEFINKIQGHGFWKDQFIVQEKAHGANMSFWTNDGKTFYAAKRSGRIEPNENFYNHDLLLAELQPRFENIWKALVAEHAELKQMTIYGEVIGGAYPHPEVTKNNKAIKVQKGISYSPDNHFFAFDILLNAENYLDVETANSYFEKEGLLYAKNLFSGSIEECLKYPNDFDSTIPKDLGLPEVSPNTVEGVIIRPAKASFFNSGVRVILKNKNEKWSENLRYNKVIKKEEPLPEKIVKLQEALATYATENRLNNVLSKLGEVDFKDFGKILGLFNKDTMEDFLKDYGTLMEELEKKERKLISKSLSKVTPMLVRAALRR